MQVKSLALATDNARHDGCRRVIRVSPLRCYDSYLQCMATRPHLESLFSLAPLVFDANPVRGAFA